MTFPFDVSHLAVRKYQHLGEGIDFGEVIRMKGELTEAIQTILKKPTKDSPVYTFFSDLDPPSRKKIEMAVAQSSPQAVTAASMDRSAAGLSNPTMSVLMGQANTAITDSDFEKAKILLTAVRTMAPKDPYILQRLALATYKSKSPNPLQALKDASVFLAELVPEVSTDTETLGLWGAIHKRVWDLTKNIENLNTSLFAYEKGFCLKNDYYNGINLAFLYDLRASLSTGTEAAADIVIAQRTRKRVLTICETLLSPGSTLRPEEKYWAFATMAEAYTGLREAAKAQEFLALGKSLDPPAWMIEITEEQLASLRTLLSIGKNSDGRLSSP